jgi:hypothetical protein
MNMEEKTAAKTEQSQQGALVGRSSWPYWPQVLVAIGILIVAGLWCWWAESGNWVVRVNGTPVSKTELQQETSRAESSIYGFDPNAPGNKQIAQQISGEILQKLVDEVLLRQAASRAGISASPEEVDTQVLMDMMNTGGQDQLEQVLKSHGYTLDQYRQLVAENITISKLGDYVTKNVTVTESEVRAAYDANRAQFQQQSFADIHDQLQQQVLMSKKNDAFLSYLDGLQQNSFIERRSTGK